VLYEIATGANTVLTPGGQGNPTIDGDLVAYEDETAGNSDIYVADLVSGALLPIATTAFDESSPVVGGGLVVFERSAGAGTPDVIVHDLASSAETNLGPGLRPHTDGVTVVLSATSGAGDKDILVYDVASGNLTQLAQPGDQTRAHVDGDMIAYDDNSTGIPDVAVRHLPSGATTTFGGVSLDFLNDLSGNRIAYSKFDTDAPNGNLNIWVYEFSLLAGDVGVAPLAVDFGDVAVGDSSSMIVTITNEGQNTLDVTGVALVGGAGPIGLDAVEVGGLPAALPITLGIAETADVTLGFAPGAAAVYGDTLRVTSWRASA
jgi:beta propeller repeat protein